MQGIDQCTRFGCIHHPRDHRRVERHAGQTQAQEAHHAQPGLPAAQGEASQRQHHDQQAAAQRREGVAVSQAAHHRVADQVAHAIQRQHRGHVSGGDADLFDEDRGDVAEGGEGRTDDQAAGDVGAPQGAVVQRCHLLAQRGLLVVAGLAQAGGHQHRAKHRQHHDRPGADAPAEMLLDYRGQGHADDRGQHQPGQHDGHGPAALAWTNQPRAQRHAQPDARSTGHAHRHACDQ